MVYKPNEDSFLLQKILLDKIPKLGKEMRVLEVGCGSGILLEALREVGIKNENILGSDINFDAVQECQKKGFNCIVSDLFENIPKLKFDLIIFNPPYLPEDPIEPSDSRIETTGGKSGSEIINRFLSEAGEYLERDGRIFILVSSLTKKIKWGTWQRKKIAEKNLFFEKLIVYELRHNFKNNR